MQLTIYVDSKALERRYENIRLFSLDDHLENVAKDQLWEKNQIVSKRIKKQL